MCGDLGAEAPDVLAGIIIITRPDPQRHMSHMIAIVVPGSLLVGSICTRNLFRLRRFCKKSL